MKTAKQKPAYSEWCTKTANWARANKVSPVHKMGMALDIRQDLAAHGAGGKPIAKCKEGTKPSWQKIDKPVKKSEVYLDDPKTGCH